MLRVNKVMAKALTLLSLAIVVMACAGPAPIATEGVQPHPPVSVTFQDTDTALFNRCMGYGAEQALQRCSINMLDLGHYWRSLRDSGQFRRVLYQDDSNDYEVAITTAFYSEESVADVAMSYLSGLTFTLYPIRTEHQVEATISVRWRDKELKRYHYRLPFQRQVRLYYPEDDSQRFADELLANFLHDARRDQVFSQHYLYQRLGASDYQRQLLGTESIDGFTLASRDLAANPYRGLHLNYKAEKEAAGQYEVMVYPVPRTEWDKLDDALLEEELRIRHSQAGTVLDEVLGSIDYADSVFVWFEDGLTLPVKGLLFRGEITPPLAPTLWRDTYIFLQHDKFIQVRVTCPDQACLARGRHLARSVALGLEVPGESAFMAELRSRHRRISLNR